MAKYSNLQLRVAELHLISRGIVLAERPSLRAITRTPAPRAIEWRLPPVLQAKGYGSLAKGTMALDVWEAFRQNSETIGLGQELKRPRQRRLPRLKAPLQSHARTSTDAHAARLAADLARITYFASSAPTSVFPSSSTPPILECCDDRLNPPRSPARPSMA